jgi:hypothetical protein
MRLNVIGDADPVPFVRHDSPRTLPTKAAGV